MTLAAGAGHGCQTPCPTEERTTDVQSCLVIDCTGFCRGLVPAQHVAGAGKKGWPKVGQKVSVRVLDCDASSRRLTLTMKRLLLEEKLAPFTAWEVRQRAEHLPCRPNMRQRCPASNLAGTAVPDQAAGLCAMTPASLLLAQLCLPKARHGVMPESAGLKLKGSMVPEHSLSVILMLSGEMCRSNELFAPVS